MSITVAIVEDNVRFAADVKRLLDGAEGFTCVAVCSSAEAAIRDLVALRPQVVLMDIHLPGASGVDCVRQLKEQLPNTEISMLTAFEDYDRISQSIFAGASGYLLKGMPPHDLLTAIREVHAGGVPMTSTIARKVLAAFRKLDPGHSDAEELSSREQEVLAQLAKGRRYKEIAAELTICYDTVRTHVRNIYRKLHVRTRAQAVKITLGRK